MPLDSTTYLSEEIRETIRVFSEARDLIAKKGWCQGAYA